VWSSSPPLTYHPTSQVYLNHHCHIDNLSNLHLTRQTLNMRNFAFPKHHYPPPLQHSTTVVHRIFCFLIPKCRTFTKPTEQLGEHAKVKKEAVHMAQEAGTEQCAQMKRAQQEQSQAVMHIMQNRNLILMESQTKQDLAWKLQSHAHLLNSQDMSHLAGSTHNKLCNGGGPIRRNRPVHGNAALGVAPYERVAKAHKHEFDDDHLMSSSDIRSPHPPCQC
jgi:hypothetical protein